MIIDAAEPMANSLRPAANGHRHFRLQIGDCIFAEAVSREPQAEGGPTATRFDAGGKAGHEKMFELVGLMLDPSAGSGQALHMQLPKAKTPHEQESLKRTIAATDRQIDALVYELYGLTENGIPIVGGAT